MGQIYLPDLELGPEWALLELSCRGLATPEEQEFFAQLVKLPTLNWGEVLEQAIRHKLLRLLTYRLQVTDLIEEVPRYIKHTLINAMRLGQYEVEIYRREAARIVTAFAEASIPIVATKGIAFESTIYAGSGARYMGDLDFMLKQDYKDRVVEIMSSLDYTEGRRDWAKGRILPVTRKEKLIYQMSPDHLPKLLKLNDDRFVPTTAVDFAFSLTWTNSEYEIPLDDAFQTRTYQPIPGIDAVQLPVFGPAYHFMFTILHFFREAWFARLWSTNQDVNLIKCADIILFWQHYPELHSQAFADLLRQYNVVQPVIWVLAHIDRAFGTTMVATLQLEDAVTEEWLASLKPSGGTADQWRGTMRERLRSKNRLELLVADA